MTTKPLNKLTLRDRLSRLTHAQVCKLLGANAAKLLPRGGTHDINIDDQVSLSARRFELRLGLGATSQVRVKIVLAGDARRRLRFSCSECQRVCEHVAAAFSLILEEKLVLGLAAPPPEPGYGIELSEDDLVAQAILQRAERARKEKMTLRSQDAKVPWTDYTVTSARSGKAYRLALRGSERGASYCSCPDFRKNTLGTCKHLLHAMAKIERRFPARLRARAYRRKHISVSLRYGKETALWWGLPARLSPAAKKIVVPVADKPIADVHDLLRRVASIEQCGHTVHIYPDAEEYIQQRLLADRLRVRTQQMRKDPDNHPLRTGLLKADLLPYQLDGIAFCAGAGRAVLADDMGLGKTIQAIGVAEFLARTVGIGKVLVVCPASVKAQWRSEIVRFCDRDVQLVIGKAVDRAQQYAGDTFFTVCNYEQVRRDLASIEKVPWDLIVLDEGQRIKNWETKTSAVIKGLRSPFALVLSGTPLENRLDDLYSIVEFVDERRLAPAFRFFHRHRVVDEGGKVVGFKNLDELRAHLAPILLRRTRDQVARQLPARTTKFVHVTPTAPQLEQHNANMQIVAAVLRKKYISEMDLLRLRKALLACRMAADSTFLVDKRAPGHSSKLDALGDLFDKCLREGRKVVLFSEWTTMLDLIEEQLAERGATFVRLDGSVPQAKRQALVHEFQNDPDCRLFLTSNAGATGLNLQAANTVINVDLPWNPAVLEQRIGRVHRMGQKRPVQVFVMVTDETIEENLLGTLAAKRQLADAALDSASKVDEVDMQSNIDELKQRLEILLGATPEAVAELPAPRAADETADASRQQRVATAGGQLLAAAFQLVGELLPAPAPAAAPESAASQQLAGALKAQLALCTARDAAGRPTLTLTLPSDGALDDMARVLANLLAANPAADGPVAPRE